MKIQHILTENLPVTAIHERPPSGSDDTLIERSIADHGIQQPLVALRVGDGYQLVDGGRRILIAKKLGIPKVPVAVHDVPKGEDAATYGLKLRFHLDEHRQDLLVSQRAQLLEEIRKTRGLNSAALASYLGVAAESVRNWLDPLHYCKEVVDMLDAGTLTLNAARVFVGMTEHGQKWILKHDLGLLTGKGQKDEAYKVLRAKYPPAKFKQFYLNPEATERNLGLAKKRRANVRAKIGNQTAAEKKRLLDSVELKQAEFVANKEELAELKADIDAAIPVVSAIMRQKGLQEAIPETVREEVMAELERFAEVYC